MKPKYKKRSDETTDKHIKLLQENDYDIIFIGTSMFERFTYAPEAEKAWKKYDLDSKKILNCGVGGDRIENILYRLLEKKVLNYVRTKPSKVVLMCGANDVDGKVSVDKLVDGVKQLLTCIRGTFPESELYLIGAYPRLGDKMPEDKIFARVSEFNKKIKAMKKTFNFTYQYFGYSVVTEQNQIIREYFVDNVHFNEAGYDLFASHLAKLLT